jgi:hypothetical protein
MERKPLPVGVDDYKKLIEEGYYNVDKSLIIKELLDKKAEVTLIPRPRRFGKTLNMSMLRYFFEITDEDRTHLFKHKKVWKYESCQKHFGQYPVIFLSFKTVKESTFEKAYINIVSLVAKEFGNHRYLMDSKNLTEEDHELFYEILKKKADEIEVHGSLKTLSDLLCKHHGKPTIILLDEYDTPINAAYAENYYKPMVMLMRNMLHAVCKGNNSLAFGVMTGIMRTAKEGIFSGLNNLKVCTLLSDQFADKFGFAQQEVDVILEEYGLTEKRDEIREWYNGYSIGKNNPIQSYNPWSIINCVDKGGEIEIYWGNASGNEPIRKLIAESGNEDIQSDSEKLLQGECIESHLDEGVVFPGIEDDKSAIWSLLLFSGYITSTSKSGKPAEEVYSLKVPNRELSVLFFKLVRQSLTTKFTTTKIKNLLQALTAGDAETFQDRLIEFIQASMSVYDFSKKDPEKSYHLFVLGLLAFLRDRYDVTSNRESGDGRCDIMLKPHDPNDLGIIIEIKKKHKSDSSLEAAADKAIAQIAGKKYSMELKNSCVKKSIGYGIAFLGKDCIVRSVEI